MGGQTMMAPDPGANNDAARVPEAFVTGQSARSALTSDFLQIKEVRHTPPVGSPFPWQFVALSSAIDTGGSLVISPKGEILLESVVDPILQGAPLISLPMTRNLSAYARVTEALLCEGAASSGMCNECTSIRIAQDVQIDERKLPSTMQMVALNELEASIVQRARMSDPPMFLDYQIFTALGALMLRGDAAVNRLPKTEVGDEPWAINPEAVDRLLNTAAAKHANASVYKGRFIGIHKDEASTIKYGCRTRGKGAVINVTVAMLGDEPHAVFVEQFRPPVGGSTIEWPAGLIGDTGVMGILQTAKAESSEEVGLKTQSEVPLFVTPPNTFCFEPLVFVKVVGTVTGEGGGVETESIRRHFVPLEVGAIKSFLDQHAGAVDPKVYAGLYFLRSEMKR